MPLIHLTDKAVKALKPSNKQLDYWDTILTGLVVRVSPGGKKSFYVVYRNHRSQRRRVLLGDCAHLALADARLRARELMGEVASGADPAEEKQRYRASDTFSDLCSDFLRFHAEPKLRASSVYQANWTIERELKPRWGKLKACDIRRRDIIHLLEEIAVERGHAVYANRVRSLISSIYTFGVRREAVETSPCVGLPEKFEETPRERVLSDAEICAFWRASAEECPPLRDLFRLILLLGQRPGETKSMEWLQLNEGAWRIPGKRTKNGSEQVVPLPVPVQRMLEAHRGNGHKAVFVVRFDEPIKWIRKAHGRIAERMVSELGEVERWTPHDLRRTCTSGLEKTGAGEQVIAQVLNHSKASRQGVTAVYARYSYLNEKRLALEKWCEYVFSLVGADTTGERIVREGPLRMEEGNEAIVMR
jgi:integrase